MNYSNLFPLFFSSRTCRVLAFSSLLVLLMLFCFQLMFTGTFLLATDEFVYLFAISFLFAMFSTLIIIAILTSRSIFTKKIKSIDDNKLFFIDLICVATIISAFLHISFPAFRRAFDRASEVSLRRSLSSADRNTVLNALKNGDPNKFDAAMFVMIKRGFLDEDRGLLISIFEDEKRSEHVRHSAAFGLTLCPKPHPQSVIDSLAKGLTSNDPMVQLSAAWALGETAPDAPQRFEIITNGREKVFLEKYNKHVPIYKEWWKTRKN